MFGDTRTFFGVITGPPLVRQGQDVVLPGGDHTRCAVYGEMLLQVMHDYSGLGDFRILESDEIEFFYDGIRSGLKKDTKPKGT